MIGTRQGVWDWLRRLNKYTLNQLTRRFAGKPRSLIAVVRHIGRRSGKLYETPIIVQPLVDGIVILLAFGANADWYRNVLAAGNCRILWQGQEYTIGNPQRMYTKTAYRGFPMFPQMPILRLLGSRQFLKM